MKPLVILAWLSFAASFAVADDLPRRPNAPLEKYPGVDVIYDAVSDGHGHRLRMIVTKPHESGGAVKFPTIFVGGWLSCDSVEAPPGTRDATSLVFQALAATPGFVLVRVDKIGCGDSEGKCGEADFATELDGYRAAFRSMARYDFIDRERIFIFGIRNGGGFAPLVPENTPVRGYVVIGGWVKTWFEHMMEIERRRFTLAGKPAGEVNRLMRLEAQLHEAWLMRSEPLRQVFAQHPELHEAWAGEGDDHLYGRPLAFYQQLQQLNLEAAWAQVRVPVLALHGQFDWIMSRDDLERIAALVNANTPGQAEFRELPATGHTFEHYENLQAAFASKVQPFDPANAQIVADWFKGHR